MILLEKVENINFVAGEHIMKKFMFKSILALSLMSICVLIGMQMANDGIHKMKGYQDTNLKSTVSLSEKNDNMNASMVGNDQSTHDLQAKKERLEKINAFNLFSSVGKKLSDGITRASEKMINSITQ